MSDVRLPPYLQRRDDREVDRSRLCECVDLKEFRASESCTVCGGSGLRPSDDDELTPDEIRALGYEPMPADFEANFQESYIPGLGGSGRPHR